MRTCIISLVNVWLLAVAAEAEVRVFVQEAGGAAWIKYECTAGEKIRAFALDVSVDRGQIIGISDFFVGPSSAATRGYGIFPAAFRDHVAATVTSGTSANWGVSGYNPLAAVADAPADTLAGLGSGGVTLEFGALWNPALPAAAPAASGTLCALQLSRGAYVRVAANASRGGVLASPDGNVVTPVLVGAAVGPLPEIAVEQPVGTDLTDGGSRDFGTVAMGSDSSLSFTIRNTGSADLTGLVITKDGSTPADFTITSAPVSPVSGPNGTTTFTVRFTPAATGSRGAVIHIANNDSDENPFDLTLSGTGITAFDGWMTAAGVPPEQAGPAQTPQGDGVPNLLKFAFNMDPTKPDVRELTVGADGTAGLPGGAMVGGVLRIEFLRRQALTHPGLTYLAEFSPNLATWVDLTYLAMVTPIDGTWERVVVDDPYPWLFGRYGRVKVVQAP
ncbi:MAG: choice-of-anchor D domain-containing protein [Verrucomicrobia bacterium]|nr:choice-of-anchor D domain-containing protein [Verrucomicrobiota bacterium]